MTYPSILSECVNAIKNSIPCGVRFVPPTNLSHLTAEQTATDLSKERNPEGLAESAHVAKDGAEVARNARADIEQRLGHSVISSDKAIDHITPKDELSFIKEK